MKIELPEYQARADTGEWVTGLLTQADGLYYITAEHKDKDGEWLHESWRVNVHSLAIYIPGVRDSSGEQIFSALNPDGVGGSVLDDGKTSILKNGWSIRDDGTFVGRADTIIGVQEELS